MTSRLGLSASILFDGDCDESVKSPEKVEIFRLEFDFGAQLRIGRLRPNK